MRRTPPGDGDLCRSRQLRLRKDIHRVLNHSVIESDKSFRCHDQPYNPSVPVLKPAKPLASWVSDCTEKLLDNLHCPAPLGNISKAMLTFGHPPSLCQIPEPARSSLIRPGYLPHKSYTYPCEVFSYSKDLLNSSACFYQD